MLMEDYGVFLDLDKVDLRQFIYLTNKALKARQDRKTNKSSAGKPTRRR